MCDGQVMAPVGLSDAANVSTIKLFCPRCLDIYEPASKQLRTLDGCSYGKTAAHLMFQTYADLRAFVTGDRMGFGKSADLYVAKVFGFRVHPTAISGPRMQWLRRANDGQELCPRVARTLPSRSVNGSSQSLATSSVELQDNGAD